MKLILSVFIIITSTSLFARSFRSAGVNKNAPRYCVVVSDKDQSQSFELIFKSTSQGSTEYRIRGSKVFYLANLITENENQSFQFKGSIHGITRTNSTGLMFWEMSIRKDFSFEDEAPLYEGQLTTTLRNRNESFQSTYSVLCE